MTVSYAIVAVPWIIFGAALAIVCFLVFAPRLGRKRRLRRSRWPTATPGDPARRRGPAPGAARRAQRPGRVAAGARDDREQSAAAAAPEHNTPESTQAGRQ